MSPVDAKSVGRVGSRPNTTLTSQNVYGKSVLRALLWPLGLCAVWCSGCAFGYGGGVQVAADTQGHVYVIARGALRGGAELNNPYEVEGEESVGAFWVPISGLGGGVGLDVTAWRPVVEFTAGSIGITYAESPDASQMYTALAQFLARVRWDKHWDAHAALGPSLRFGWDEVTGLDKSYTWTREYSLDWTLRGVAFELAMLWDDEGLLWSAGLEGGYTALGVGRFSLQEPPEREPNLEAE